MKKLFIFAFILIAFQSNAQYKYYKDSTYNSTFSLLSSPTSVNNGAFWDDDEFVIPLGFYFRFFKDSVNEVTLTGSGGMLSTTPNPLGGNGIFNAIVVHGSDLQDKDTSEVGSFSPISYSTSGTAPNRICKIEWKNAGFYNPLSSGVLTDVINLQAWLYETSDVIEMRFGNGTYTSSNMDLYDGGPGAWVGIFDSFQVNSLNSDCRKHYFLTGNTTAPILDSVTNLGFNNPPGMTGSPASGRVYRFTPKPKTGGGGSVGYSTLTRQENLDINHFDASSELRIDIFNNEDFQYSIFNINGRILSKGNIRKGRTMVSTSNLAKGVYILNVISKSENVSYKFSK